MAWIELHQAIWTHRKTLILAAELDLDETYAAAHMIRLWTWALDNAPEGNLSGLPAKVIAYGAGWRNDPDTFVEAAVRAGWLDRDGDCLVIHDWQDYAGRLIEKRRQDAKRKRQWREESKDVQRTSSGRHAEAPQDGAGNLTVPNHTVPNQTGELNIHASDGATAQLQPGEQRKRARTPGASPESVEAQKVTATGKDKPRPPFKTKRQQEMFDDFFWPAYPKKRSKGQAEKAWVKLNPSEELFREIMAGVERAKASEEWQRENGQFIPYPATWLNAKGWEDEYTPAPPRKGVSLGAKSDQHPGAAAKDQELDLDKFCWPGTRV